MAQIKLSKEDIADLKQAQRQLLDVLPDIDRMEQCGVECQEERAVIQEALERANALLKNFGPGPKSE